jgi:hypothetical protein
VAKIMLTTKTGRHDIAETLLKVALKHQRSKSNQSLIDHYGISVSQMTTDMFHLS